MAVEVSSCPSLWTEMAKKDPAPKEQNMPSLWTEMVKKDPAPKEQSMPMPKQVTESFKSSQGISVIVVDSSALIDGGEKLMHCAERVVSVKEVLNEIKDPVSRHRMAFMRFPLHPMEPSEEALKKVISFARATGDLQSLSDVDLKLLALTYTLEAQAHGTAHLRTQPPPLHVSRVRRLPEKDPPGWGSNVPNLDEWDALEQASNGATNSKGETARSHILGLKTLTLDASHPGHSGNGQTEAVDAGQVEHSHLSAAVQDVSNEGVSVMRPRRHMRRMREVKVDGKLNVAEGIDASKGEPEENVEDWQPAVTRSNRRRYLRRQARRALSQSSVRSDQSVLEEKLEEEMTTTEAPDELAHCNSQTPIEDMLCDSTKQEVCKGKNLFNGDEETDTQENLGCYNLTDYINRVSNININEKESPECREDMLEHQTPDTLHADEVCNLLLYEDDSGDDKSAKEGGDLDYNEDEAHIGSSSDMENLGLNDSSVTNQPSEDSVSEQSWNIQPFSNSSVACATNDFAMQNVILQMGLRLLTPNGVRIHQLHRWLLKCHACNGVTADVSRIFCPKCGNHSTLRKISVTVGGNGIVQAGRRQRISIRGTRYSLPQPKGGRDAVTRNPILREDQLAHKLLYPKTKKTVSNRDINMLSIEEISFGAKERRVPLQAPVRAAVAIFSGRRNPNDNHFSRHKH